VGLAGVGAGRSRDRRRGAAVIWLAVWVAVHALPVTWVCEGSSEELRAGFPWTAVMQGRCDPVVVEP